MHSWNITCCIKHGVILLWNIKFIKYRENKLIFTKYVQGVRLQHKHKHTSMLAIGQLHHQSATAPNCTTHAVDAVAARWCHEPWSYTHIAEWQTKWHNRSDLDLVSSVATFLVLWNLEWCVVAVQLSHVQWAGTLSCWYIKWRHVYVTSKTIKLKTYLRRTFIPLPRYVKLIKIRQDFPKLWSQMYCHLFVVHSIVMQW